MEGQDASPCKFHQNPSVRCIANAIFLFLPHDALQCKAQSCYHMSSVRPSVCLRRWWIMTTQVENLGN